MAAADASHFWSLTGNSGTNPSTNFLGTTDNQPLVIKTNGAEAMRVAADGKVGIGTSSPVTKLELVGGSMRVVDGDDASVTAYSTNNPSRSYLTLIAQSAGSQTEWRINNDGPADSKLTFCDATAGNDRMVLDRDGNLGIGTSDPLEKVEVVGGSMRVLDGDNASLTAYSVDSTSRSFLTLIAQTSGNQTEWRINNDGAADSKLTFYDATAGVDRMVLDRSGNLGVGTTSPARKLHISDAMRLEPLTRPPASPSAGDLYFDDSQALCVYVNGS